MRIVKPITPLNWRMSKKGGGRKKIVWGVQNIYIYIYLFIFNFVFQIFLRGSILFFRGGGRVEGRTNERP